MESFELIDKLKKKYPKLNEEPLMEELEGLFMEDEGMEEEGMEDIGEMEEEMPMEDELELEDGDEDMLESYEDEDEEMLGDMANSDLMGEEGASKKKDHKRRMALRKALRGG